MALCVSMDESTICIPLVLDPSYWSTVSLDILVLFFLRAQASRSHSSFSLCLLYLPPTFLCRMTFKILKPWQGGVCGHQWSGSSWPDRLRAAFFPWWILHLHSWAWAWS